MGFGITMKRNLLGLIVSQDLHDMSRDVRKPVFGVSDQVRHKPGCAITE